MPLHVGARNLDDDVAILEVGGETLVLTHDAMAEGVHFRPDANLSDVAWKLVAANLSDLAAKGAEPEGLLLSYSIGDGDEDFLAGLSQVLAAYAVPLLGGDTIKAEGGRSFGLTAIGRASHTPVPSRSGAKPGDNIWVCGTLGAAMLGYDDPDGAFATAQLRPEPLLAQGRSLAPIVTAMMDVSDGLLLDAKRMAMASDATFELASADLDIADRSRLLDCLSWGDDYALLFTCDPSVELPVEARRAGQVVERGAAPITLDGEPVPADQRLGYSHG